MEETFRRESPPVPAPESCGGELTRSSSDASYSYRRVENFSENATADNCSGWTNEKHNTFLYSLEASFVKQLHRSMVLRSGRVELRRSCRNLSEKLPAISFKFDQFTIPQEDYLKKIDIEREQPALSIRHGNECRNITDFQFCAGFHMQEVQRRDMRTSSPGLNTGLDLLLPTPKGLLQSVSRITEGSGQNFEEDTEERKCSKKLKSANG